MAVLMKFSIAPRVAYTSDSERHLDPRDGVTLFGDLCAAVEFDWPVWKPIERRREEQLLRLQTRVRFTPDLIDEYRYIPGRYLP